MYLRIEVIERIWKNIRLRNLLCLEFNVIDKSVKRWLEENQKNNPLTTVAALNIISEELVIPTDEIVTKGKPEKVPQN